MKTSDIITWYNRQKLLGLSQDEIEAKFNETIPKISKIFHDIEIDTIIDGLKDGGIDFKH